MCTQLYSLVLLVGEKQNPTFLLTFAKLPRDTFPSCLSLTYAKVMHRISDNGTVNGRFESKTQPQALHLGFQNVCTIRWIAGGRCRLISLYASILLSRARERVVTFLHTPEINFVLPLFENSICAFRYKHGKTRYVVYLIHKVTSNTIYMKDK